MNRKGEQGKIYEKMREGGNEEDEMRQETRDEGGRVGKKGRNWEEQGYNC